MVETKDILNLAWPVGAALLGLTAVLLYVRRLHREFPWFFGYVLVVLGKAPLLFFLRSDRAAYFYVYWLAETLVALLSFFVFREIYRSVAGESSLRISRSSFFSLNVGFLAVAALAALFMDTAEGPTLLRAILILTHVVRTMQVGLLAVLVVASLFFNLYWKSMPFGITLGYGLYAAIELVATAFRSALGPSGDAMFQLSKVLGYQLAVLIWIVFLLRHRRGHALQELPVTDITDWLPAVERSSR